jgi:hypothetical protein
VVRARGRFLAYRREAGIQPKCRERSNAKPSARDDRNWPFMPPRGKYTALCSSVEGVRFRGIVPPCRFHELYRFEFPVDKRAFYRRT